MHKFFPSRTNYLLITLIRNQFERDVGLYSLKRDFEYTANGTWALQQWFFSSLFRQCVGIGGSFLFWTGVVRGCHFVIIDFPFLRLVGSAASCVPWFVPRVDEGQPSLGVAVFWLQLSLSGLPTRINIQKWKKETKSLIRFYRFTFVTFV